MGQVLEDLVGPHHNPARGTGQTRTRETLNVLAVTRMAASERIEMGLPDTHLDVEHVSGRWLKSLERYADARKRYPEIPDSEFGTLAREYRALISVGKQADLYVDIIQFKARHHQELAEQIASEPLPELTLFHGHAQAQKLQEQIRWMRAAIHRELGRIAWYDHGIEMHNTHFGTHEQLHAWHRREAEATVKQLEQRLAQHEQELASVVAVYSQAGWADLEGTLVIQQATTKGKRRRKS